MAYTVQLGRRMRASTIFAFSSTSLLLLACSAADPVAAPATDDALNAVPGAYQARLRASSGEDIVFGFDRREVAVAGRPECRAVVAEGLRVAVSSGAGIRASRVDVKVEGFLRGRTIAFGPSAEDIREARLSRASAVSFRGELPGVVIERRCSGEPIEIFQKISVSVDGRALVDPIGDRPSFWSRLEWAGKTGISAAERRAVSLTGLSGAKIDIAYGRLVGDDPRQPGTCEETQAAPVRVTVRPALPARAVTVDLVDMMRGPTVAATRAPSSPGLVTLSPVGDGSFSADIPPFVVDSRCSGTRMDHWQTLAVTIDGAVERDALHGDPFFELDLAEPR